MPFSAPGTLTDREWEISSGEQRAVVHARGAALRSYQVGDAQVVDGWADDELPPAFNGAVLAPWPNRIRDGRWQLDGREHQLAITEVDRGNALHGLVAWADWQLRDLQESAVTLGCRVPAQPGYPFELDLQVCWSVSELGLRCEFAAHNISASIAPFGISAHPFFGFEDHRVDELTIIVPATQFLRTDDRLLPTGLAVTEPAVRDGLSLAGVKLDTAFTGLELGPNGTSAVILSSAAGRTSVWADQSFGWWQVYTSDMFDRSDDRFRRSVAIEPMTCGPDAFNTGVDVIMLAPDEHWQGAWGVRHDR